MQSEVIVSALNKNYQTVIKVVGVGGGGVNSVNRMIESDLRGVEFVAVNTDAQQLLLSNAHVKLDIGRELTRGLGAGGDPEVGRRAAEEHEDEIRATLAGSDMVFVTTGEGGGTGTGASPVVARIAKSAGALTVGVVTRPFEFEGKRRSELADMGIEALRKEVDALIVVPNERLLEMETAAISVIEAFKVADDILRSGVQGITDLIINPGLLNLDFQDVKAVLQSSGAALMGIGAAKGEDRAIRAAEIAISNPLLETSIDGAHGAVISIAGASDMGLKEMKNAANFIKESLSPEASVKYGTIIDDTLGDEIRITVIAAGFDGGVLPVRRTEQRPVFGSRTAFTPPPVAAPLEEVEIPETPAASTDPVRSWFAEDETAEKETYTGLEAEPRTAALETVRESGVYSDGLDIPDFLK